MRPLAATGDLASPIPWLQPGRTLSAPDGAGQLRQPATTDSGHSGSAAQVARNLPTITSRQSAHTIAFDRLRAAALHPDESVQVIERQSGAEAGEVGGGA
jgi:hypothetical protein